MNDENRITNADPNVPQNHDILKLSGNLANYGCTKGGLRSNFFKGYHI